MEEELKNAFAISEIASWMMLNGWATGPGDSIADLLSELVGHVRDTERARCVNIINRARQGEIDTDLRSIRAHIEYPE